MLDRSFFQRDPVTCARELIGCELVWNECAGIVVETEAYAAVNDEACHTFFRPSAREFIASREPGSAYIYLNYGMYWLLNALVKGGAEDGFVLFRAIEPSAGLELMSLRRHGVASSRLATSLCSGPGKLTIALGINGHDHGRDLCAVPEIGFRAPRPPIEVEADARIGISRAAHLPWRFLAKGSAFVSARPAGAKRLPVRAQ